MHNWIHPAHRSRSGNQFLGWYGRRGGQAHFLSLPFVGDKEECLVPDHRPAQRPAKLVIDENILGLGCACNRIMRTVEVVACVQMIIAEEFETRAVNIVRARLGDDVDDGS